KEMKKRIFLFLSPQYLNYGDHAIALSEIEHFQKSFPEIQTIEINYSFFEFWTDRVQKAISPMDVIVITGGGYIGSLWEDNEKAVERIVEMFPNNKIIFAPQTIFFLPDQNGREDRERLKCLLRNHGNFFFCLRDMASCQQMKTMGFQEGKDYRLIPDFVLFLESIEIKKMGGGGILVCMRNDKEAEKGRREKIIDTISENYTGQYTCTDMSKDHVEIPVWMRKKVVGKKFEQFAKSDVVVTDRLHAMLFAAYTGTPCVAFDNVNGKVRGVYEWIRELNYVKIATDPSDMLELIHQVRKTEKNKNREAFLLLQKQLKSSFLHDFDALIS
ncbi:MAG: polysaccharide pyruvyl transferase family protein, partial [Candidatus Limivivens sp.]|nr:polysaccharide pyruvyl transferase family protein [Candidatus Limivivens sp.]